MKTIKKYIPKLTITSIIVFTIISLNAQNVVISEFHNNSTGEWAELLITTDNADLRGYTLRDNGTSQASWQATITFSNNSFWNNLRAGTVIVLWFSSSSTFALDTNKNDGYIELHAQLSGYTSSSGGSSGGIIVIGGSGELLQLRNASATHIHALAYKSTSSIGADFTALSNNKLNHNTSSMSNGESILVCPGTNLNSYLSYNTSTVSYSGIDSTSKSSASKGLPNSCTSSTSANQNYWRSLRQPTYNNPTLNTITANSNGTQFNLSWSACADPNPSDSTTGYLILRNTTNSFTNPTDNTIYSNGNIIGTATVVTHINFSSTLAFTDNYNLNCGDTLYYKIYAFRYKTDNNNVSNLARGRAYNETGTNVQSITKSQPISQNISAN